MTNRQLQSRRNAFIKAGLDPQLYDDMMSVFCQQILSREPGSQKYTEDPAQLKEVFELMNSVWQETVYPADQPPLAADQIPFEELYNVPGYLTALLECWHNWTYKSAANVITFIRSKPQLQGRNILVLADGFGATSIMCAKAFPGIRVFCHIMGNSSLDLHKAIQSHMQISNLETVVEGVDQVEAPIVLAFECFEHFIEPQKFAAPFLARCNMLVHSSPWSIAAHGHFKQYVIDGTPVPSAEVPRMFGKWLKTMGFQSSAKTFSFRFFNGDPEMYFKDVDQLQLPNT
jgi:hypothetical protein